MAKRFTESMKWEDSWFRRLSPVAKLFWLFIVDKCDIAGIWEVDWELASFYIGEQVDESILKEFEGRLERLNGSKIWVVKFIEFQYGVLNPVVNLHQSVIRILEKQGLLDRVKGLIVSGKGLRKGSGRVGQGLGKGSGRVKVKVKEKDINNINIQDIQEEDKKKEKDINIFFERFWVIYPKRGDKKVGRKECFEFIKQKIRQEDWEDLLRATENYAKSEESKDGFARDPIRFLKKDYWRDWVDVKDIKQLQRFNEDTHFRCEVCKTIKLKQDRVYVDGKAVCGQCEKEIDEEKKKDEQLFREQWEKMKDEEKQEYIRRLKRLNIPVPGWMVKEEK